VRESIDETFVFFTNCVHNDISKVIIAMGVGGSGESQSRQGRYCGGGGPGGLLVMLYLNLCTEYTDTQYRLWSCVLVLACFYALIILINYS
jgi:hypothetical protein